MTHRGSARNAANDTRATGRIGCAQNASKSTARNAATVAPCISSADRGLCRRRARTATTGYPIARRRGRISGPGQRQKWPQERQAEPCRGPAIRTWHLLSWSKPASLRARVRSGGTVKQPKHGRCVECGMVRRLERTCKLHAGGKGITPGN